MMKPSISVCKSANVPDLEELDSFNLAFFVLMGTLTLFDVDEAHMNVLKASKDTRLWGPESVLLSSIIYKGWIDHGGADFTDKLIDAFDTSGDISVNAKRVEAIFKKYKNVGKKVWKEVEEKALAAIDKTAASASRYFKKQRKDAEKSEMMDAWEKFIKATSANHIRKFLEAYPERIAHPQIKKLVLEAIKNPNLRTIDRANLLRRVRRISNLPKQYIKNVSDIHAGRIWNFTGLTMAREQGVREFQVISVLDNLTCPVCMRLHGTRFKVEVVHEKMVSFLSEEGNQDAIAKAFPFPRMKDVDNISAAKRRSLQTMPPFHGKCRCDIVMLWSSIDTQLPKLRKPPTKLETPIALRNRLEKGIYGRSTEKCYALDNKGNIVFTKEGGIHNIVFTQEELAVIPEGATFTHNHPGGTSFSPEDLFFTFKTKLKEMRAVGKEFIYSFKIDWKVWAAKFKTRQDMVDYFFESYETASKSTINRFYTAIKDGSMTPTEASFLQQHTIISRMAKYLDGITYSKKRAPWA